MAFGPGPMHGGKGCVPMGFPKGCGKGKGMPMMPPGAGPGMPFHPCQVPVLPGAMARGRSPPPAAMHRGRQGYVQPPMGVPAGPPMAPWVAGPGSQQLRAPVPPAPAVPPPPPGPAPLQQTTQGQNQQLAGTVVTKTTVEKMFIPADPSSPPVQLGGPTSSLGGGLPGLGALPAQAAQAPVMVPVPVQQVQPMVVPAIMMAPSPTSSMTITNTYPQSYMHAAGPLEGTVTSNSYAPIYDIDDHMDNQALVYEDGYQVDAQGFVDQVIEGNGMYQLDDQPIMYAPQYYDDQQFNEVQMNQQQYSDDGYVDYLEGPQVDGFTGFAVGADAAAGIPRPQEEKSEDGPGDDQFTRLLNSLEARVDLMAQMQHTRAEIQKHTRNLQNTTKTDSPTRLALPGPQTRDPLLERPFQVELEPERPFSNLVEDLGISDNGMAQEDILSGAGAQLVHENAILRNEFEDQKDLISRLGSEVVGMRSQLRSLSVEPQPRAGGVIDRTRARTPDARMRNLGDILAVGSRVEARWMKDDGSSAALGAQWENGYICKANEDGSFQVEYDNGSSCLRVPKHCLRRLEATVTDAAPIGEVQDLQLTLQRERSRHESSTQQWCRERRRLLDELSTLKCTTGTGRQRLQLGNLPTVGESEVAGGSTSMLHTQPVFPAMNGLLQQFSGYGRPVAPLSRNPCGMNIELSEDGYSAKRVRGCRQSVVLGSAPLEPQELGHYFEVVVKETVNGWVGGLGIGVTRVPPAELKRMPDKAWRIPNTFIVGYWGCLFLDGREKRTRWKADTLTVGSRVGLLVTGDGRGDLIVFVDGEPVVRADDVLPSSGLRSEELYPIIDVFAATLAVELQQNAVAPAKPWSQNPSPPGSPASAARSICSSTYSAGTRQTNLSYINA